MPEPFSSDADAIQALAEASERLSAIHRGDQAYVSDKAFAAEEVLTLSQAVRLALSDGQSWLFPVLDGIFHDSCVAPGAARTMPSQALCIALGHAIRDLPTHEAVAALASVAAVVRHAGVKKKLQRDLRVARTNLSKRSDIALRLPCGSPPSRAQMVTFTRALENSLSSGSTWTFEEWRERFAQHPDAKAIASTLIWRIIEETNTTAAVLPEAENGRTVFRGFDGQALTPNPGSVITLWHPADATAEERAAWRDRMVTTQIKQPFKQAFREIYALTPEQSEHGRIALFAGHIISLRPLLGVALQQGWRFADESCLTRHVGRWDLRLEVDRSLHPGANGWATTQGLSIRESGSEGFQSAIFAQLSTVALSETLRSVDLLVSSSGFGVEASDREDRRRSHRLSALVEQPLSAMAMMRKEALARVLAHRSRGVAVRFDARHLRIGPYALHLATGRVTRDGEEVAIERPRRSNLTAVPWLPYDEKLLEHLAFTAVHLIDT